MAVVKVWWWQVVVVVMVMMNITDTKAECQGEKQKLSTTEGQEQLNLTTLELDGQEDTIQLHVDLYIDPDNRDPLLLFIFSSIDSIKYHLWFTYESNDGTEALTVTCRDDTHINMTTPRKANQSDPSPRSIILKLESTQVTVTETTTGVNTTGPLVCPITKRLSDPKDYQLLLKCHKDVTNCGHAFICTEDPSVEEGGVPRKGAVPGEEGVSTDGGVLKEGAVPGEEGVSKDGGVPEEGGVSEVDDVPKESGVPVWCVVLLLVMTVLVLFGFSGCLYYRRKAIANRSSSNNGGGAGIEGQHYNDHKQHQMETPPKGQQETPPKPQQKTHPKDHQEKKPKDQQETHPKDQQKTPPKPQQETPPKPQQDEPPPQQEPHQGASRTSSYNSINSIYQPFQSHTE